MAILDETDSGLDIDALRVVANGVNAVAGPDMGVLIITHYQRILHLVQPSHVHVMYQGRIVKRVVRSWSTSSRRRATAGSPTSSSERRLMSATAAACASSPSEFPVLRRDRDYPSYLGLECDLADAAAGDRRDDPVLHRVAGVDPSRRVPARG